MRRDLANARMGQLVGADGRTYSLRAGRVDTLEVEALIESGWPVVTYYAGGRLVWHDEDDAWPAWADARASFSTGTPEPDSVTGGLWESVDGGTVLVLVWHD